MKKIEKEEQIRVAVRHATGFLTEENIRLSLAKLGGIRKKYKLNSVQIYLRIQEEYKAGVNNGMFQERFNYYYKVRLHLNERERANWKNEFFKLFGKIEKGSSFSENLKIFHGKVRRIEASFISKMLATIDPNRPIIDSIVFEKFGLNLPGHIKDSEKRIKMTANIYEVLGQAYQFLKESDRARNAIKKFDNKFGDEEYKKIPDVRKLDFLLWALGKS